MCVSMVLSSRLQSSTAVCRRLFRSTSRFGQLGEDRLAISGEGVLAWVITASVLDGERMERYGEYRRLPLTCVYRCKAAKTHRLPPILTPPFCNPLLSI